MTFGEKVKKKRLELRLSQDGLAKQLSVSRRTVIDWESNKAQPRTRKTLDALAAALQVPASYLLTDNEEFILDSGEYYGYRGRKGAEKLVNELTGLFAGGELADEDMDVLMFAVQQAYMDAKKKNKKYTPKKYLKPDFQTVSADNDQ